MLDIEEIGYSAHLYAEHASRVESNFHDINRSFEDIGVSLSDLYTFAANSDEIPFTTRMWALIFSYMPFLSGRFVVDAHTTIVHN